MNRIAIYPGSFDPPTRGHEDLIRRALTMVDRLIVAVAINPAKDPLFTVEERLAMLEQVTEHDPRIEYASFSGLLADFARKREATIVVRGLRAVSDFEYEFQMALMNRHLAEGIETVFMAPSIETSFVSSSLVRQVARFRGDVGDLVHPTVAEALRRKYAAE